MKKIAIIGCTGLVGQMLLKVLEERDFPISELYLMASSKSEGLIMTFKNRDYKVEALTPESFDRDIDIAFLQPVPRSVKNMYRLLRGKDNCY